MRKCSSRRFTTQRRCIESSASLRSSPARVPKRAARATCPNIFGPSSKRTVGSRNWLSSAISRSALVGTVATVSGRRGSRYRPRSRASALRVTARNRLRRRLPMSFGRMNLCSMDAAMARGCPPGREAPRCAVAHPQSTPCFRCCHCRDCWPQPACRPRGNNPRHNSILHPAHVQSAPSQCDRQIPNRFGRHRALGKLIKQLLGNLRQRCRPLGYRGILELRFAWHTPLGHGLPHTQNFGQARLNCIDTTQAAALTFVDVQANIARASAIAATYRFVSETLSDRRTRWSLGCTHGDDRYGHHAHHLSCDCSIFRTRRRSDGDRGLYDPRC